jgi:hypothetical protein
VAGRPADGEVLPVNSDGLLEDGAMARIVLNLVAEDHRARRCARVFFFNREVAAVDRAAARRASKKPVVTLSTIARQQHRIPP